MQDDDPRCASRRSPVQVRDWSRADDTWYGTQNGAPVPIRKLQRASTAIDEGVTEHLRAALTLWDITRHELEELVVHFAVYLGWNLARHLDDPPI